MFNAFILGFVLTLSSSIARADLDFGYPDLCTYMAERYAVEAFEEKIGAKVQSLGDFLTITTSPRYAGPGQEPTEFYTRISNLLEGGESANEAGYTTIPDVNVRYRVLIKLDYSKGTHYPIDICQLEALELL